MIRIPLALVLGALVVVVAGCGGGEATDENRAELTDSLAFLRQDYDLEASQVRCVVDEIEAELGGDELDDLAAEMRAISEGSSTLDDLDVAQSEVVTAALTTCAAVSEP